MLNWFDNDATSFCIVNDPAIASLVSALKKFPPAITVADVFVVLDTSSAAACADDPLKLAPIESFNVIPGNIFGNPVFAESQVASGVNSFFDKIATLTFAAYIEETTCVPPVYVTVSITHPDCVCPSAHTGPTNFHDDPV